MMKILNEALPQIVTRYSENLKNISRPSQAEPRRIPVAAASRQPGLGVDDLPTSSLRCVRLCFQQVLG